MDSLKERFDAFYEDQPKVSFTKCELGYIPSSEGPMEVVPFGSRNDGVWKNELRSGDIQSTFRYQGKFSLWT